MEVHEDYGALPHSNDFSDEITNELVDAEEQFPVKRIDGTENITVEALVCKNQREGDKRYLSHTDAREIIKKFVQEQTSRNGRPRFVPVLNKLMEAASERGVSLMTFQLGGWMAKLGIRCIE